MTAADDSVIVFDLDDTLYLERDFARSGFAVVGGWMQDRFGIADFAASTWNIFETGDRSRVFDDALASHGMAADDQLLATLVALYRRHLPTIALAPDAADWLARHRHRRRLAIITDGQAITQSNKLRALGLDGGGIAPLVCTGHWGPAFWKPHPRGFEHVEAMLDACGADCVYVADNPAKDFITPRARGWRTVQIIRPGAIHALRPPPAAEFAADVVITSLADLDTALADFDTAPCGGAQTIGD